MGKTPKSGIAIFCLLFCLNAYTTPLGSKCLREKPGQNREPAQKSEEMRTLDQKGPTFDDVIGGATRMEGLFNLYLKEDRVYLELLPEHFGKMFLFVPTQWTSIGRGGAGRYLPEKIFVWQKLDKKVLLIWKNVGRKADRSLQYQRALKNVVPDSIAFSFKIESEAHPKKNSLLIAVDDFFFSDLQHFSTLGDSSHPTKVDKNRTVWGKIKAFPRNVELEVRYTVESAKPLPVSGLADPGVFTLNVRYSVSELPVDNGYRARPADDRVGFFVTKVHDFDKLGLDGTTTYYINRWRLEKKNVGAKMSEPVQPIVFWLENTIPLEYRKPIRDGILEWNKAFERIGFKNAVVVKEMPDDADWDPADIRYNTIRWIPSLTGEGGGAMGPSRVNPLTGEILDADVTVRAPLSFLFSYLSFNKPLALNFLDENGLFSPGRADPWDQDNLYLGIERDFGILDMFVSGKIKDIGEVPDAYVYDALKHLACHEVGHTLGLRHNFKGSSTISIQDLQNTRITSKESIGNSIMEYLPINLAPKGVEQGDYFQTTLGAWDYWAIEYGYVPLDVTSRGEEAPELEKIALRASEPELAYGSDEDAYDIGPFSSSIDPLCVTFDLSSDPLLHSEQQIERIEDLWQQLEDRILFEGHSYVYLRRAFKSSLLRYFGFLERLTKWIGGVYHSRVHVQTYETELPFKVVEYDKQRKALEIIKTRLLRPASFGFSPSFIRKLQIDRLGALESWDDLARLAGRGRFSLDFSLSSYFEQFFRGILLKLYDPMRLHRIQDNEARTDGEVLTLERYCTELFDAVWEETDKKTPIGTYRRTLQREHLARVTDLIQSPSPALPYDAVVLGRYQLRQLQRRIAAWLTTPEELDVMTRAHLEHCSEMIEQALKTSFVKSVDDPGYQ